MRDDADDERGPTHPLLRYLGGRLDPLTSAVLAFPLLAIYQLGILSGRGQNGVDFITRALIGAARRDLHNYVVILGVMLVVYGAVLVLLRRRGTFHTEAFVPMLLESAFYALVMGSLILYVMSRIASLVPSLAMASVATSLAASLEIGARAPLDTLVISAGAGFHEELVFRLGIMGGVGWLLSGAMSQRKAWLLALVVSSLVFSLAHHVGPAGEPFRFAAFVYRSLAGVFFALVYQVRGFAVAAWTHALYDVYVLSLAG